MPDTTRLPVTSMAQAIGKIPSGLHILTVRRESRSTGMLASWVQQAGFDPPMLTVAIRKDRYVSTWIEESGRFALSQLREGCKSLIRHFGKGFDPDSDAFNGLDLLPHNTAVGGPVLKDALAWLDAKVDHRFDAGDHWIVVARVIAGALIDPKGDPTIHVRGNGLHY